MAQEVEVGIWFSPAHGLDPQLAVMRRGGHEVLVWPHGRGVVAMINNVGLEELVKTVQYSEDGISFHKMDDLKAVPAAPGAFRPEAFRDSRQGEMIEWGLHIGRKKGFLPFLERFDCSWGLGGKS